MIEFRLLPGLYSIVRLASDANVPAWASGGDFASITRTADELSIICLINNLPKDIPCGESWICLKLEGPFPFSQTGVLLSFIQPLSNNGIPIFVISTYDTDYVLIQQDRVSGGLDLLRQAGHELIRS